MPQRSIATLFALVLAWCCLVRLCAASGVPVGYLEQTSVHSQTQSQLVAHTRDAPVSLFHQCTSIDGNLLTIPVCIDITLNSSCVFTVSVTVAGVTFERQFVGRLPPEICVQQAVCQICIRFDDLTASSGCIVLALVCQGIEVASSALGCFAIPVGPCLACPKDCSGHGDCNNGGCICEPGYSGVDCSTGHPGAFWKKCVSFPLLSTLQFCLELSITICDVNIAITTQNLDGTNNQVLLERSIHIEELELNPETLMCASFFGCEICMSFKNFTLNATTHLATGCPVLTANCFGGEYKIPLDCFVQSGIIGTCADCPDNCNGPDHGVCTNGVCECKGDWKGVACAYKNCLANCSGHGTCEMGNCVCANGWTGDSCALECPVSESNIDQLNDGEVKEIVLNAGQSYGGYLLTKVNLAGLTFVLQVKNNSTLNAYARRNCYASSEYHDADKLNIVPDSEYRPYYGLGTIFHVVQDCYLSWRGDRWFLNVTCVPCATCENQCKFVLTTYVSYVTKLRLGIEYRNISILPLQRHYYTLHVAAPTDDYLSLHVVQTPTDEATFLSLIALQKDRCPTIPPYEVSITKPTSSIRDGSSFIHKFFLADKGLRKGDFFLRIDGCSDSNAHRCEVMNYTMHAQRGPFYCTELCNNGGACSAINTCKCTSGWEGSLCERPICNGCKNGICAAPGHCICNSGWVGAQCDSKPQESSSSWGTASVVVGVIAALVFAGAIAAGIIAFYYWRRTHRPGGYGLAQFQELELEGNLVD